MSNLPFSQNAIVESAKIHQYLLNLAHPRGGPKAKFFYMMGFNIAKADVFESALLEHARTKQVVSVERIENEEYKGTKYLLICEINTPIGKTPCIKTIWAIEDGTSVPKLTSAYPN